MIDCLRLIVRGPLKFDDYALVKKKLDSITRKARDIVLIDDKRPDAETSIMPSSFPLAYKWFREKWRANVQNGFPVHRFSMTKRYHCPFKGDKKWSKGVKARRLEMIQNADALIAFWDVGGDDYETEAMVKLAKKHKILLRVILT